MAHRHPHHTRSTSYPESVNLSLLSFSRSLSTVPSLSSESIFASLSSVSFPDQLPTPQTSSPPNIIPLKDNILTLSPPLYSPKDSPNSGNRSRVIIAAPTSPRIKQIQEEPTYPASRLPTPLPRHPFPLAPAAPLRDEEGEDEDGSEGDDEKEADDVDGGEQQKEPQPESVSTPVRLQRLTQLHILRFLRASPAFSFSAPSPTHTGHTHLYTLLMSLVKANTAALASPDESQKHIGAELRKLVRHVLAKSIAFRWTGREGEEEEIAEVDAWLDALPR
ncbi:hypothetical protein NMY22_g11403 [Coprinellus aureogranulatus]|nr:hypothetical protein NMY22_g11403 [Coprinellus aureogranulatus]